MGSLISTPVIQINDTKLNSKEFRELKTFKDVMRVAGHTVDDMTTLHVSHTNGIRQHIYACESFHFVDGIQYDTHSVYIRKLYGKH
jgi:hypothetical protein